MIIYLLLLLCVLPFQDLKDDLFAKRQAAVHRIIQEGTIEEIVKEIRVTRDAGKRHLLGHCLATLEIKKEAKDIRDLLNDKKSDLIGWSEFSKIVGDSNMSRKLYVAMFMREGKLIRHTYYNKDKKEYVVDNLISSTNRDRFGNVLQTTSWSRDACILFLSTVIKDNTVAQLVENPNNKYYNSYCECCGNMTPFPQFQELIEKLYKRAIKR